VTTYNEHHQFFPSNQISENHHSNTLHFRNSEQVQV
jgi:hypothetical protein